ncbi:TPA: hypothetical protein LA460_000327 [Clostridium botulinum]|nr:hypothetical protein [Clostridium botulinum]
MVASKLRVGLDFDILSIVNNDVKNNLSVNSNIKTSLLIDYCQASSKEEVSDISNLNN